MFKLRYGYLISGIITGSILIFSFFGSFPDGKLHIVFCDVGQGDAAYVRFPDGQDMVVDGGPNDNVLGCLGKYMPFWDRHIDLVMLSHPQKDHLQGLISVLERFNVGYFVRSDVEATTEGYAKLMATVTAKKIPVKYMSRGEKINLGTSSLTFLWPSTDVLGASTTGDVNDYSLVFALRYGTFDALFTGDADQQVERYYVGDSLSDGQVELLKVPHHGSKTGMSQTFLDWLKPRLAVISVGKNSYGHPSQETIRLLRQKDSKILRTDQEGDVEVITDGKNWTVRLD